MKSSLVELLFSVTHNFNLLEIMSQFTKIKLVEPSLNDLVKQKEESERNYNY